MLACQRVDLDDRSTSFKKLGIDEMSRNWGVEKTVLLDRISIDGNIIREWIFGVLGRSAATIRPLAVHHHPWNEGVLQEKRK